MTQLEITGLIITIIMGFGWGSLATMATYRIPRGMTWIGDKPRCFMCKAELNILDYFSVFSYFIHHGKCRHCKGAYECSLGYFITELAITVGFCLTYLQYGFSDYFALHTLIIVGWVILGVVDAENDFLPAKILITLAFLGAIYRTFIDGTFYGGLYGAISCAVIGLAIRSIYFNLKQKPEIANDYTKWQHEDRFKGPGFDYVKLLGVVGIFLPFIHIALFIASAGLLSLTWHIISPKTLRMGSIAAFLVPLMIIYPAKIDALIGKLF